ncbi:putative photosynthetic complex assembly protein PuhE [Limimaricola pyoseonensis]|uniref:Putative photosynthetic complex assembly protein 2 n=1 Tax=Limimaricola pyoseonensis TaxID=521013 RepID=A0A1G7B0M3_9RHOB|nr:putative photosynthetic complex assembly protein PuhE [Limimaricola pyoseonensis]SDE20571.1 putative photosynthetic complex assembly protein 2 [Limimaricola pyoseonensis]
MPGPGPATAALLALFLWWFSTGAILLAVRRAERHGARGRWLAASGGLPLLGLGAWGLAASLGRADPTGVLVAFVSAVAVWGWIELAFLTGLVTGPNRRPCPPGLPGWERFLRGWGTVAHHDMALTAALLLVGWAAMGAANPFGFWTFAVLYAARISAQLNLFLGVPRVNLEFLPAGLGHLASHFRIAGWSWLFPVSVTGLGLATGCWLERLMAAGTPGAATGFSLLAAITALALVEHWLMVLPLPDAKLWRWMLPDPPARRPDPRERPHEL